MIKLGLLLSGFLLASTASAKVPHKYIVEICDEFEEQCAVLSVQGESIGFIATEKDSAFVEGVPVVFVSEEFYQTMTADLERQSITEFEEEDNDDIFLEAKKGPALAKLYKAISDMAKGGRSGGGGGGSSKGTGKSKGKKTCGNCHTDGKHSHHPPT